MYGVITFNSKVIVIVRNYDYMFIGVSYFNFCCICYSFVMCGVNGVVIYI